MGIPTSTIVPTEEEKRDLYNLSNQVPFDDRVNHEADLADLDPALIKAYLREVGSSLLDTADTMNFEDLCRSMNIAAGPHEYVKPKNVGLMFFSAQPERFFPCAQIDVVEFPDGLGGARIFERTFDGPLYQQLRDALRYLQNSVIVEQVVKHPDRAEADRFFNYPYDALKEALANAVYHKGYDVREPVEVRVLPERIEILSYPGADRSVSLEGLRTYRAISRRYRNRRVGDFLNELHLTEVRNTGMAKILRTMRQNGSPDPVFETDEDRLYFLTTLPVHPGFLPAGAAEKTPDVEKTTPEKPAAADRAEDLVAYLAHNPSATSAQIARELGVSSSTVGRLLADLKLEGRVRREGASRNGRWVVEG
jgi:ATP-dependent DNA helicase RecG